VNDVIISHGNAARPTDEWSPPGDKNIATLSLGFIYFELTFRQFLSVSFGHGRYLMGQLVLLIFILNKFIK
jgi:hypothetical protein